MKKEFIPYELAVKLKALGFDEPCFGCFNHLDKSEIWTNRTYMNGLTENITAPTFSQSFRWFREKYNLFGCIDLHSCIPPHWFVRIDNMVSNDYVFHSEHEDKKFTIYEEAELACLTKLIEIVEQTNN